MKIVITGASGFVGQQLVPLLEGENELLLVGRSPARLAELFGDVSACTYDELDIRAAGFDVLVHLAVVNNNAGLPAEAFRDVNVRLLLRTAEAAKRAGVGRFVNVSSIHALDDRNLAPYASTKREGAARLQTLDGLRVETIYLAAVYGSTWSGKLAALNKLPAALGRGLFQIVATLRPTVHVKRLADFIVEGNGKVSDRDIILSDGQVDNRAYRLVTRSIDLVFALLVAVLLWWALVLIWLAVRLTSPGPGVFSQERVGREGRSFTCYKFRTMVQGTANVGTDRVPASAVTPLGRFLRWTKLDELPQIVNLLRNEMSLVGPRPCLPTQTELVEARRARGVLRIKPGISGLAQINGIDMSEPVRLAEWDARYVALQSLILDLKIGVATLVGKGQGDRVAQR